MRHSDINTTLSFYVDQQTADINGDLWAAYNREGNTLGNIGSDKATIPAI